MNNLLIYIEDELIDLYPGTVFTYTYQNVLIGSLTTRRANYSNEIKVPKTENNRRHFLFADIEKSTGTKYKQKLAARVVQNGFEILNGFAVILNAEEDYSLAFYSGFIDFVDSLGDQTIDDLYDLDTNLYTWNQATINSARETIAGLAAHVVNYGHFESISILTNADFSSASSSVLGMVVAAGWEQVKFPGPSEGWAISSGSLRLPARSIEQADGNSNTWFSDYCRQKFRFINGQPYTITLSINAQGDYDGTLVTLVWREDGTTYQIDESVIILSTPDTLVINFTPTENFTHIGFYSYLPVSPPGFPAPSDIATDVIIDEIEIDQNLNIGLILPQVHYHSVFSSIVEAAGYSTNSDDILDNTIYKNLIIPFCKDEFKFTGLFNKCREFEAELSAMQTITADGNVIFDTITKKDLYGYYNPTTGYYSQFFATYQPEIVVVDTRPFYSKFFVNMEVILVAGSCTIYIKSQGEGNMTSYPISSPGKYFVTLSVQTWDEDEEGYNFGSGDSVFVYVDVAASTTVQILKGKFYNSVNGLNQETTPRFFPCEVLPEIKKKDFVKDMFVRFGIVPKEKNKVLHMKTFEEIISDRATAIDWTNKRDKTFPDKIDFKSLGFAQKNYFRYPVADDVLSDEYNRGSIDTGDETLVFDQDLYESLFNASTDFAITNGIASVYCASIPLWSESPLGYPVNDGENDFSNTVGNRLLISRAKQAGEVTIYYNGVARTDYRVANFNHPTKEFLQWRGFLEEHYPALMAAIRKNKTIVRRYYLTDEDIAVIDPHKMIYDDGSYFLLQRINNYVPGLITEVELFKVS